MLKLVRALLACALLYHATGGYGFPSGKLDRVFTDAPDVDMLTSAITIDSMAMPNITSMAPIVAHHGTLVDDAVFDQPVECGRRRRAHRRDEYHLATARVDPTDLAQPFVPPSLNGTLAASVHAMPTISSGLTRIDLEAYHVHAHPDLYRRASRDGPHRDGTLFARRRVPPCATDRVRSSSCMA